MLWTKALHIIFMVTWFAGLFYLPRLFVYHAMSTDATSIERFKLMERKLMRVIINPSMIATWLLGLALAFGLGVWSEGWFHLKFALVVLLSGLHGMLSRWRRDFEHARNTKTQRFYRIVNEVPAVLMIGIVILVVVKPF